MMQILIALVPSAKKERTDLRKVYDFRCPDCGSKKYECLQALSYGEPGPHGRDGASSEYRCADCGTHYEAVFPDGSNFEG